MFGNSYNYFFAIWFDWEDIFNLLSLPTEMRSRFRVNEELHYLKHRPGVSKDLEINSKSALFEYYIIPNSLQTGNFKSFSTIYDQQSGRFYDGVNIRYFEILKGTDDSEISCFLRKNTSIKGASSFTIRYSEQKEISFYFDAKYLNCIDAHKRWGEKIELHAVLTDYEFGEEPREQVLRINPEHIHITMHVQSQQDF